MIFSESFAQILKFFSLPTTLLESDLTEYFLKEHLKCPPDQSIKFLLYLSAQHGDFPTNLLGRITSILPNVAVAGALVDKHILYDETGADLITEDCVTGLAVIGNNCSCSSLVLSDRCRTEEDIERRLHSFRQSMGPLNNQSCLAILVFCVARNINCDVKYFKKYFEGIPTIGLFGYGEFGRNVVNNFCSKPSETYDHAYSTVISLISFD